MSELCEDISEFLLKAGFSNLNAQIFEPAFTHPSYSFEHSLPLNDCYERLEFLGDAVLKLLVSNLLYFKFPDYQEGKMTNIRAILVSDDFLFNLAEDLNLKKYLRISSSLEKEGGRNIPSLSACAFEAFLGKLYEIGIPLDEILGFISKMYSKYIDDIGSFLPKFNSKALLQEYTQDKNKDLPQYELISLNGAENNCEFLVKVLYHGEELGIGRGKTKKQAEREAAHQACIKLNIIGE
ncbi:MAG: ribonuclease III [Candidatus Gastranaerophilaceae bacterium]